MKAGFAAALVLLATCNPALAERPPLVSEAFANMPPLSHDEWAFTRSLQMEDEQRIERYDPRCDERWLLIGVDGRAPDQKRLRKYRKNRHKDRFEEDPGKNDFDDLADDESWRLLREDDTHAVYGFSPRAESEEDEKINGHLQGTLTIARSAPHVESFEIASTGPFRASIARINTMRVRISMQRLAEGAFAVHQMRNDFEAKALFKNISQQFLLSYSQFEQVAPGTCPRTGREVG